MKTLGIQAYCFQAYFYVDTPIHGHTVEEGFNEGQTFRQQNH